MKICIKTSSSYIFLLHLMCIVQIVIAYDTINTAQIIRDGDTIVSSAQNFELGFFSPGSSQDRYVGIWFKNVTVRTVFWVANRKYPLRNTTSGVLTINRSGNLVILDETNTTIWSTNASRAAANPVVQLLNSGNLVIRDASIKDDYLWQSFDYLTDTTIPGTYFGWNFVTGNHIYMSSWKNMDDPAPGEFTMGLDLTGYPQIMIKRGNVPQYRIGYFNGLTFSGFSDQRHNTTQASEFIMNSSMVYYRWFGQANYSSMLTRYTLSPTGVGQFFMLVNPSKGWQLVFKLPVDTCDDYATCGAQGLCNSANVPVCGCLDRFVVRDSKDWATSDWSGGCVRKSPLNCQNDVFLKYTGIKMPDTRLTSHNASSNLEECEGMCSRNCSCTAYTSLNVSNGGSGCLMWFGDLVDIKKIAGASEELYIRLAASELAGSKWTRRTRCIAVLTSLAGLFLLGIGLALIIRKVNKYRSLVIKYPINYGSHVSETTEQVNDQDLELPMYDFSTLAKATNNFSVNNKLGEGGFGSVYKGTMEDGKEIAVKRLSKTSSQGHEEFKNEVLCIAKLRHRNLVKLLGWCIQGDEKMLIYEYMPNKSLDSLIFNEAESRRLDWPKRLQIIYGIAKGLLYLHQDSCLRIIHRDLKASNVLLDNELNPKISDFGLARIFEENETEGNTLRVVGTYGYMSPEYAVDGFFSIKSDVYSFGVLVLEIVSGHTNRGFHHKDHHHNLVGHAWILYKEGRSLDLVHDPNISTSVYLYEVLRSIHAALLCVQQRPEDRPSMGSVALMLESGGDLPEPREPGFFTKRRGVVHGDVSNECTNSLMEGR